MTRGRDGSRVLISTHRTTKVAQLSQFDEELYKVMGKASELATDATYAKERGGGAGGS